MNSILGWDHAIFSYELGDGFFDFLMEGRIVSNDVGANLFLK